MIKDTLFSIALILASASLLCTGKNSHEKPAPVQIGIPSRTVKIPMYPLTTDQGRDKLRQIPGSLAMTPGGEDESPTGPEGFDVREDGGFVITDPLQKRLVVYDSLGSYLQALPIGVAASNVSALNEGVLEVREANTGNYFLLNPSGERRPVGARQVAARIRSESGESRKIGSNRGLIFGRPGRDRLMRDTLEVEFESDTAQMVSLRSIGVEQDGYTYVVIETTTNGTTIRVKTIIRKYSPDGKVVCEVVDVPDEPYITPLDPFRVRKGVLYQLLPREHEVEINVWDISAIH